MNNKDLIDGLKEYLEEKIKTEPNFISDAVQFISAIATVPENIRVFTEDAAKVGWFITSESFMAEMKRAFDSSQEKLDSYMFEEIDSNYIKIKQEIINNHPKRRIVLECAFELHEKGNWIASIPLFLAQTDGICAENIQAFLFSEHDKRKENLKKKFKERADEYMPYLYSPFEVETQFSASISSKAIDKKKNGPNRNGILHGSRKHLDYGSKLNSYKCISLLSYISMVFVGLEQ